MSMHLSRRILTGAVTLLIAAGATAITPDHGGAQNIAYTHTTFLHGLGSNDTIWELPYPALGSRTPPQYLSQQVDLGNVGAPYLNLGAPGRKDSTLGLRYAGQRDNLTQFVTGAAGQHVLVGHSLGSLVGRGTYGVAGVGSQRVSGIVTIAAPHLGAPIADSAQYAVLYMRDMLRTIQSAQNNVQIIGGIITAVGLITMNVYAVGIGAYVLDAAGESVNFPVDGVAGIARAEALQDLGPNAATIQYLKDYRGDGTIPRANITGSIPYEHAILRLATAMPGAGSFEALRKRKEEGLSSLRKCRTAGNLTFNLLDPGNKCQRAARMLRSLDARWAGWVNGTEYGLVYRINGFQFYGQVPRKIPFDGVVPHERSVYPTSNGLSYTANVPGANHLDIYRRTDGLDVTAQAMLAIRMREAILLTASISGPTSFESSETLTWSAAVQGGDGTYAYTWSYRPEGVAQWYSLGSTGASASLGVNASTPSFAVRVTVSSQGQTSTASTYVTNTIPEPCVPPPGQSECYDQ